MHLPSEMLNDLRYAWRTLRHNPGFALTAIVSIALGIGANSAIFSLADGLLFRPLPVPDPAKVVTLRMRTPSGTFSNFTSWADYKDFRERSRSFDGMVAYELSSFGFAASEKATPEVRWGYLVSGDLFQVLHTEPALGRAFLRGETEVPGRNPVIVLSHRFWKNDFAADPSVIGRRVRLNGIDFTVVGVAPEKFTGLDQYVRPAFYIPAVMGPSMVAVNADILTNRSFRSFLVKGRLKPGVSIQAADKEASAIAQSLAKGFPQSNRGYGAGVWTEVRMRMDEATGDRQLITALSVIVLVALLIACANVANLMIGRGRARAREIAVRLAIGASRARLVRQLLVESSAVALAGGLAALLVAGLAISFFSTVTIPGDIPIQFQFELDFRVLLFTLAISILCALLFGLIPAFQSTRTDLVPALKAGELSRDRERWFGRNALVVVQVTGSLVLLVAATQLYRGISYVLKHDLGFRTDHLIIAGFKPDLVRYSNEQAEQFYKKLQERAAVLPGVRSASVAYTVPTGTGQIMRNVIPEGFHFPAGQDSAQVPANIVDPDYFRTIGMPILRGREFRTSDGPDSPRVAVVNEQFARKYWPNTDPVGKRFRMNNASGPWVEVIGVSATGKVFSVLEPPMPYIYLPYRQDPQPHMMLLVYTQSDPAAFAGTFRHLVRSIDQDVPIVGLRTMADFFEQRSVKVSDVLITIVAFTGLLGLTLALVGLYAVVSYQVTRRTREIGIRMAIGADRANVVRMVLRQAAWVSSIGVSIGLALTVAASRALSAGLELPPFNATLVAAVAAVLLGTTLVAAAVPARRASRVDPIQALRQE